MITKIQEQNYIEFTENNDHEGELWSFFVLETDPLVNKLKSCIKKYNQDFDDETYSYRDINSKDVEVLMKRKSKTSYMNEYNLCSVKDPVKVIGVDFNKMNDDQISEYLYKGKCFKKL